jgi:hypothetical protein
MHRRRKVLFVGALVVLVALTTSALAATAPDASNAKPARLRAAEFFARSPYGTISCAVYDGYASPPVAFCESVGPHGEAKATINASGEVLTCSSHSTRADSCGLGNAGIRTPTYRPGRKVTVGRFRCVVLHNAVQCTVRATGKGFLFTPRKTSSVGGAHIGPAPLQLSEFRSPDHDVWCETGTFCGTGLGPGAQAGGRVSLATISAGGGVTICAFEHNTTPGYCLQNWNEQAPVLRYGQQAELDGVLCTSATDGITCVKVAEPGKGKGFRINKSEAVEIG